jgi:hypothetical protein
MQHCHVYVMMQAVVLAIALQHEYVRACVVQVHLACLRHVHKWLIGAHSRCCCRCCCCHIRQVDGTVNVRTRDNVVHGMFKLADVVTILQEERDTRALQSIFTEKKGMAQEAGGAAADAAGQEAS